MRKRDFVLAGCCLLTALLVVAGCGKSGGGAAGVAYTESEDGSLVPVEMDSKPSGTSAPSREEMASMAKQSPGEDEQWLTKFELVERSGKTISSEKDLKGQPYVAGFFFTLCPTICPRQNEKVQQLQQRFKDRPVRFLSISCDPEIDTPAVLTEYAKRFDADPQQWLFLTGELPYIRRVGAEMYLLPVQRRFHAEKFVLVDAEGENVGFYAWDDPGQWQALIDDIDKIIESGGTMPETEKDGISQDAS